MIPKPEIASRLRDLALSVDLLAADMDYYGGFDPEWQTHSRELSEAADTMRQWSEKIERKTG